MKPEEFFPERFLKDETNIYETVLVIATRARQIGELQKRLIDRHLGQTAMLEQQAARARAEDSDDVIEPEPIHRPLPQFEKPVIIALDEQRASKVDFFYEE